MSTKADILKQICNYKVDFVSNQKIKLPQNKLEEIVQSLIKNETQDNWFLFYKKLFDFHNQSKTAIIAEIKKASPSMGIILEAFSPQYLATQYTKGGCCCISVLTDEKFFMGSLEDLTSVLDVARPANVPVLQKDFIVDEYQIYNAKVLGASCILLIMSCLDIQQAVNFETIAYSMGLDVLCECHNENEVNLATTHLKTNLIGINNRSLKDFSININNTANLLSLAKKDKNTIIVCESGIENKSQIDNLKQVGCNTFLIGTSIVKSQDPCKFIESLL